MHWHKPSLYTWLTGGWRLPSQLRPYASNDLLSVPAPRPDTQCFIRPLTFAGSAGGSNPI